MNSRIFPIANYTCVQVREWRRGYDAAPPPMRTDHAYYDAVVNSPIYADGPAPEQFPGTESLEMTIARTLPFWTEIIVPRIKAGDRVLICAHSNSLRGLVKLLSRISDYDIPSLTIPMGIPFVYQLDEDAEAVQPMRFLADDETVRAAVEAIEAQIKPPT
ncbi:hypothetical protein PR048_000112 [Dryococelus australis]|uniref:phosphoglycerate mutase (2,3-diphosphoglycerate-dependent) n=1 Tax=Dryococelus australis TaxID=614101 RepID=A0ABQ9IEZ5_9NEOP|nr:hypothetical protein PR048_000112 [Dryococelus australis]